jgi:hypothetical protein
MKAQDHRHQGGGLFLCRSRHRPISDLSIKQKGESRVHKGKIGFTKILETHACNRRRRHIHPDLAGGDPPHLAGYSFIDRPAPGGRSNIVIQSVHVQISQT